MRDISLRQRALEALSRREHSQVELRRKLSRYATEHDDLDAVLATLKKEGLLSDHRFAESLAHRRAERYGVRRIQLEFEQHGLSAQVVSEQVKVLDETERERCRNVWLKKFGKVPHDLAERARQSRFLFARGFSAETVRQVLKSIDGDDSP
jgi:regulatory protein